MLALAGLALVVGAWLHYFLLVRDGRVSGWPIADGLVLVLGMAAALVGALLGPMTGGAWSAVALVLGSISLSQGLLFFWLLSIAQVPADDLGQLIVTVGDPMPGFSAWDHRGERFTWGGVVGQRVLFKFFRGHW